MSILESILTRAMNEPAFADQLFSDTEEALIGYDLTSEEFAALKSMSRLEFDRLSAAAPEEHKSLSALALISNVMKMKSQSAKNSIANTR